MIEVNIIATKFKGSCSEQNIVLLPKIKQPPVTILNI